MGRFKKFVDAYDTWIAGWANPAAGAGEHAPDKGTGWQTAWNSSLPASAAVLKDANHLQCESTYQTWERGNDQLPINCVNWYEASAFCIWDGGRLATEAEWEYAAGYGGRRKYPWGDAEPTNSHAVFNCQWDGPSGCAFTDIAVVGSVPNGNGFWGQSDLAGSMFEWVFDYYATSYSVECKNCAITSGSNRVLRGWQFRRLLYPPHRGLPRQQHAGVSQQPLRPALRKDSVTNQYDSYFKRSTYPTLAP